MFDSAAGQIRAMHSLWFLFSVSTILPVVDSLFSVFHVFCFDFSSFLLPPSCVDLIEKMCCVYSLLCFVFICIV